MSILRPVKYFLVWALGLFVAAVVGVYIPFLIDLFHGVLQPDGQQFDPSQTVFTDIGPITPGPIPASIGVAPFLVPLLRLLPQNGDFQLFGPTLGAKLPLLWTLFLVFLWIRPSLVRKSEDSEDAARASQRAKRLLYFVLWLAGFILLFPVNAGPDILDSSLFSLAAASVFPILAVWTTLVFLVFLAVGDGSEMHKTLLASYWGVWAMFSVVLLATVLAERIAFRDLQDHITADQPLRILANNTIEELASSSRELADRSNSLLYDISRYRFQDQSDRRELEQAEAEGVPGAQERLLTAMREYRRNLVSDFTNYLPAIESLAYSTQTNSESALNQLKLAASLAEGPRASSLQQLSQVMSETVRITSNLTSAVGLIDQDVTLLLSQPISQELDLNTLSTHIETGLVVPASDASRMALVAASTGGKMQDNDLSLFRWISVLYSVLVLFPWVILLLFIYRKRFNRAAQQVRDLQDLDPTYDLLALVVSVNGEQRNPASAVSQKAGANTYTDEEVLKSINYLRYLNRGNVSSEANDGRATGATGEAHKGPEARQLETVQEMNKIIHRLAERTFSNLEFVLTLLFLSIISAVGWYFVFYPRTDTGLATLIEQGAGVKELTEHYVTNATPLTMGFVGAYFFSMQMLLRRYLSNDLYPSAFLQVAVRLLVVFMLNLLLSVLFGMTPVAIGTASGVAFLAGVFPNKGFSVAARAVNRLLKGGSSLPETLEKSPISGLSAIDYWTEARLLEENVETVQGMATVEIQHLVLGTHYPTERIVNWIDESILLLHAGAWIKQLNRVGINTASKLLNAVDFEPEDFVGFTEKTPKPDATGVAWLVEAVKAAGTSSTRASTADTPADTSDTSTSTADSSSADTASSGGASTDTSTNGASEEDTSSAELALTATIVYELCKSIYPERNMKYIENFYRSSYYRYTRPDSLVSQAVPVYTTTVSPRLLAPRSNDSAADVEGSTNGPVSDNGRAAASLDISGSASSTLSPAATDGQLTEGSTDGTDRTVG